MRQSHAYPIAVMLGWTLLAACIPAGAQATEFDQSHADLGYIDTLTAVPPLPGLYIRDDLLFVGSGRLNDGKGNPVRINLGRAGLTGVKFRSTSEANIMSAAYVPDTRVPGLDGTIGAAVYAHFVNTRVGVTSRFGVPESRANDKAGAGDLTVIPIFLAFQVPGTGLRIAVSPLEFTAPTGRYDRHDPVGNNVGLNYWSYRPALAMTYLTDRGQELSLNAGLSVNARNPATQYRSGAETYVTWAAQQHLSPSFGFGVGGYYYKQIGDDRLRGAVVAATLASDPLDSGPGNRGETFAIGPLISYQPRPELALQAHWDHELASYNRPQRDLVFARGTLRF